MSTDILRRQRIAQGMPTPLESVILVVTQRSGAERIVACCAQGERVGIRVGQMRAHAQALLEEKAIVETYKPEREQKAVLYLAQKLQRFSPRVVLDGPSGFIVDLTGMERLEPNECALCVKIRDLFTSYQIHSRLAVAPTVGAARALAQYGTVQQSCSVCPDRGQPIPIFQITDQKLIASTLGTLPIEALGFDMEVITALKDVGVQLVSELFKIPRSSLQRRYGQESVRIIDEVLGGAFEVLVPLDHETSLSVHHHFDGPTTRQYVIMLATEGLLDRLAQRLRERESGVCRLSLEVNRVDVEPIQVSVRLGYPSRCASHLMGLLRPLLETINLGFGVDGLVLRALEEDRLAHSQQAMPGVSDQGSRSASQRTQHGRYAADSSVGVLFDRLRTRFGHEQVVTALNAVAGTALRPTLLFERPESIRCEGDAIVWRGVRYELVAWVGPEQVSPSWWTASVDRLRDASATRMFYRVADCHGRWLWLQSRTDSEEERWFVSGVWA